MDPVSRKVSGILGTSYGDADFRNALAILDERLPGNTPDARRRLEIEVERDIIDSNAKTIREFTKIADHLKLVGLAIDRMNGAYVQIKTRVETSAKETSAISTEASSLIDQMQELEVKRVVLQSFKGHYIVSEDDLVVLTSSAEPVDNRFFKILDRVKTIHKDCEFLLSSEDQRAGLEIMEQTTKQLNFAFQKLYRWVQKEFKMISLENPRVDRDLRRALRILAERPALFQSCLDHFSEARQKILVQSFYEALTGSATENVHNVAGAKPIEMFAHDPIRYTNDMLAWLHSAAVGEKEALEVLFVSGEDESIVAGMKEGQEQTPWEGDFDAQEILSTLVGKNLETVCKPLKLRIEQVIASHDESTLMYKISSFINFYKITLQKLVAEDSFLMKTMIGLEESALRQFQNILREHYRNVQAEMPVVPDDLSPPDFLMNALRELKVLMESYATSLVAAAEREKGFMPILTVALDPFLSGCMDVANATQTPQRECFKINCMLAVKYSLEKFEFNSLRIKELDESVAKESRALGDFLHAYFLQKSGLLQVFNFIANHEKNPDIPAALLLEVAAKLDDFLPDATMDAQTLISRIASPKVISDTVHYAAQKFAEDFSRVETVVTTSPSFDPETTVWTRTSYDVQLLLGLEEAM